MYSRIQQDDDSVPMRKGDWWYSLRTRQGEQYPIYLRRRAARRRAARSTPKARDETLLDLNEMARGKAFLRLGLTAVSRDATRLAYTVDHTGGRDFTLHMKSLVEAAAVDDWSVEQVSSATWANDSRTLWYTTMDETKRSSRLWRHVVGATAADTLLFEEADELFDIGVAKTLDERWLLLAVESKDSTEWRVLDAEADGRGETPAWRTVFPRRADVEYALEHRAGRFYVRINDTGRNFRLVTVDATAARSRRRRGADRGARQRHARRRRRLRRPPRRHRARRRQPAAAHRRSRGRQEAASAHTIAFDEPAYSVHASGNAEFETTTLRFVYTSMTTPASTWRLRPRDARARAEEAPAGARLRRVALRQRAHPRDGGRRHRGADLARLPSRHEARRPAADCSSTATAATASRSTRRSRRRGSRSSTAASSSRSPTSAAAATSAEPGTRPARWRRRQTTFNDFIACAEALVASRPDDAVAARDRGRQRRRAADGRGRQPAARALSRRRRRGALPRRRHDHARRDACRSPSASSSSGATRRSPEQYAWMRAYSPYDNLRRGAYPAMLVRSGLNDTQVAYWEPAKYVARLRTLKTDDRPLVFKINLEVGHGGASGRFDCAARDRRGRRLPARRAGRGRARNSTAFSAISGHRAGACAR